MSTTNQTTSSPSGSPTGPAQAVFRRLVRVLGDLGVAPQPIGPSPAPWVSLRETDGRATVEFGSLSIETAARLANLLEDLAAGAPSGSAAAVDDEFVHDPDSVGEYNLAPFEPVAAPLDPYQRASRFHPRTGW